MRQRLLVPLIVGGLAVATLGFIVTPSVRAASTVVVQAGDFQYTPAVIHVMPGDTIRWNWGGDTTHTVTSGNPMNCAPNGQFNGTLNDANPQFTWVVPASAAPGTMTYFCFPHCPTMAGSIVVRRLGDITLDGVINAADLGALLGAWGSCKDATNCPADLNGDGVVGAPDLGILLGGWG